MRKIKHAQRLEQIDDLALAQRIVDRVTISSTRGIPELPEWCRGCWEFNGHRDDKGYGQIKYEGKARWLHRVSYALWVGDIPYLKTVDHKCFNPQCCNPFHLRLLTHKKNSGNKKPKEEVVA